MPKHKLAIKWTIHFLLASILLGALLMSVPTQPARAATWIVNSTADSGLGSLRQAITDANGNPGPDTITFNVATDGVPIVLSGAASEDANVSGDLDILNGGDLIIQGNGAANTIIDGGGIDRIFHNCPGGGCTGTVTLMDLTVRNGSVTGSGGGISNHGSLIVQNSTIGGTGVGNTATLFGGGIYNALGTTTVDGSTVSANDAAGGGGIYNLATLNVQNGSAIGGTGAANTAIEGGGIKNSGGTTTVAGSTVSANTAGWGGGIFSQSTLNIQTGSIIGGAGVGNTATSDGGGIYILDGTTTVDGGTVSANIGDNGGGIYNALDGELTVQNGSVIGGSAAGNLAIANGGGVYNKGQAWINGSIVRDNTAGGDGGGIYDEGMLAVQSGSTIGGSGAGNTAVGDGGGIYNDASGATVDASEVSANVASSDGGGIYNRAALVVQNGSTIGGSGAGNTAVYNGGGIYNDATGTTMVTGSRILDNTASTGGGVFNDRNGTSVTSVTGSCIVGNSAPALHNNQSPAQAATGDWWGAPTGPNTPGADTTGGNWLASGYLSVPILGCGYEIYLPLIMR